MVCEYFRQKISAGSDSESASCAEIRQSKRNAAALIIVQTIFVQPYTDERADMNVSPFHMQKSGRGGKTNGNDSDEKSKEVERDRA